MRRSSSFAVALSLAAATAASTTMNAGCSAPGPSFTDARTDGSISSDAPRSDGGARDASTSSAPDVTEPKGCGAVCCPDDVSSFTPQWKPPTAHATVCSPQQVTDVLTCMFDDAANPSTCAAVKNDPAYQTCSKCLVTPSTATALGPVVVDGQGLGSLNTAGCIALRTGDASSTGCGAKYAAANECADAACGDSCPVAADDAARLEQFEQCRSNALQ